jgi:hypothetical protein
MLSVKLVGGLGNQLHCYAFGKALAAYQSAEICFDCDSGFWGDPYGRCYLLDHFPFLTLKIKNIPRTFTTRRLYRLFIKVAGMLSSRLPLAFRPFVIEPAPHRFREDFLAKRYLFNPYFTGYWASYRYCDGIEQQLRSELQPPLPTHPEVLEWHEQIMNSRSCFIHYRSYREVNNHCHPSMRNYYQKAVTLIAEMVPNVRFFVFSDHHAAARAELSGINKNLYFVEIKDNLGNVNSLNDFYLMYACEHAIIADSTFSWWAAWLSDREGKIVAAPHGLSPWGDDWAPPSWIKLDVLSTQ